MQIFKYSHIVFGINTEGINPHIYPMIMFLHGFGGNWSGGVHIIDADVLFFLGNGRYMDRRPHGYNGHAGFVLECQL